MNQLFKNLITKGSLLNNALKTSRLFDSNYNLLNQSLKSFDSSIILNNARILTPCRLYVTNTDSNSSFDLKYKRDFKEYRPRERNFPNKNFNPKTRREFQDRTGSRDEDFEDSVPVESSGKQADYSNKEHHSFDGYDLNPKLLSRLNQLGYNAPFEIQEKTLKHTLAGKDLVGKAFTGSGKTLAFAIPIVNRIINSENRASRYPKCLVLSPTRELCLQLTKAIQDLAPDMKCLSIVGGTGYDSQINALNGKVDIVCATPGRLRDLMNRKNFIADDIEIICLDEADELLNPNFVEQIHDVIEMTSKKQMLMFSATINKSVQGLIGKYMKDPITVDLTEGQKQKLPSNIEHFAVKAPESTFDEIILHCLNEFKTERCIIFTNMKREAIRVNYYLSRNGFKTSDLHSDLSQRRREIILEKFRNGRLDIIVATDVAARGIDIPEVDLVIQVGAPANGVDFYIHRSGRTGRAGRIGRSVLIEDGSKYNFMRMIKRLVKFKELPLPSNIGERIKTEKPSYDDDEDDFDRRKNFKKFSRDFRYENKFTRSNDRSWSNRKYMNEERD